jgi:hypothetical protein
MFQWKTHPQATALAFRSVEKLRRASPWLTAWADQLSIKTGTRLTDWVERVSVKATKEELTSVGFVPLLQAGEGVWQHPHAKLPLVIESGPSDGMLLALRVDSILDFANANRLAGRERVVGRPGADVRKLLIDRTVAAEVWGVEAHGTRSWEPSDHVELALLAEWTERFRLRERTTPTDADTSFHDLIALIKQGAKELGQGRAADLFFATERHFWQSRNKAGQIQKMRQDQLGLGWANHDHHTYRSSRWAFVDLVHAMELLGMECRERFYAGEHAGWGAQVMEHPTAGVVVFADVDLGPHEVTGDFAHQPFDSAVGTDALGTVGLWCALHGEAVLRAGMHHLECQFDFAAARSQMESWGVASLKPFTDLAHLRQSFTVAEHWEVAPNRVERALQAKWITPIQAEQFLRDGALGSHLEILERNDGFKGFNPHGISEIIRDTDPRRA